MQMASCYLYPLPPYLNIFDLFPTFTTLLPPNNDKWTEGWRVQWVWGFVFCIPLVAYCPRRASSSCYRWGAHPSWPTHAWIGHFFDSHISGSSPRWVTPIHLKKRGVHTYYMIDAYPKNAHSGIDWSTPLGMLSSFSTSNNNAHNIN